MARIPFAAVGLLLASLAPAWAGPQETRVGETRVVYARAGTPIRAEGAPLGKLVATLPAGTQVSVLEVKLPWVRVRATTPTGPAEGWLRAFEAVEPGALQQAPPPPAPAGPGAGVNAREVSAAGRQFDAATEQSFRQGRADLARGYALVEQMERDTAQMNPYDALDFVMEVELGRRGKDYVLPGRLPPDPIRRGGGGAGLGKVGEGLGRLGGLLDKVGLDKKDADRIGRLADVVAGMGEFAQQLEKGRFTAQQKYYIGRAVAASALARWGVDPDVERRRYVKRVGDALVRLADTQMPPNFGGYHFEVLDSPEVNGVSGPGGFVLVTRGAVEACATEDELAGILAHELAHVVDEHGEQMIRASPDYQHGVKGFGHLLKAAGVTEAQALGRLVEVFSTTVTAAVRASTEHAYGPALENAADQRGTWILYEVLYDWTALRTLLLRVAQSPRAHAHTGATHAPPAARAAALEAVIAPYGAFTARAGVPEARIARFERSTRR